MVAGGVPSARPGINIRVFVIVSAERKESSFGACQGNFCVEQTTSGGDGAVAECPSPVVYAQGFRIGSPIGIRFSPEGLALSEKVAAEVDEATLFADGHRIVEAKRQSISV